ncbi:hypothetical protein JI58_07150 [Marinosulfonomonas sp. PRT-SC04]|nr:hypothetical protein JI58_07860 [Marinosulfonomonas sp. PRT-SC04]KPU83864.1 hypothetical protein JI58_07150 [Marinosulfonomonas sp. PRT-SC04]
MKHITCPPSRRQLLQNQQLRRAREIICQRTSYSAGAIDAAIKTIAALSPHPFEVTCANDALTSRKLAA